MNFDVYGPFAIPRFGKGKLITDESFNALSTTIGNDDLINSCGCYLFAIKAGKGYKPWYVGQASKTKLLQESLNSTNREKYNKKTTEMKGTPVLFLLPKLSAGGKFAKPTQKKDGNLKVVNFLEEWLIGIALHKNPNLINKKSTFFLKNLHVTGLYNPKKGTATKDSNEIKKVLF